MKLNEKIYECRKRTSKSQEALAAELGISRQAVSKWETGEAEPDIRNLQQLAKIFGVTVDWLLLEEEEMPQPAAPQPSAASGAAYPGWVDNLPKTLGRFLQRFGWLAGVYVAVSGLPLLLLGCVGYGISQAMVNSFQDSVSNMFGSSQFGGGLDAMWGFTGSNVNSLLGSTADATVVNPVSIIFLLMLGIGAFLALSGTVLALVLRKYAKQNP